MIRVSRDRFIGVLARTSTFKNKALFSKSGYRRTNLVTRERCDLPKKLKEGLSNPFINLIKNNRPIIHQ